MLTQATLENQITYRGVQALAAGHLPWRWQIDDVLSIADRHDRRERLPYLTTDNPQLAFTGVTLLPDKQKWLSVPLAGLGPLKYLSTVSSGPDFSRELAYNAQLLALELASNPPIGTFNWHDEAVNEWHKAFICWPKLYPCALKLWVNGLV